MKKPFAAITLVATLALVGCSGATTPAAPDATSADSSTSASPTATPTPEPAPAPDLAGSWKQSNSASEDAYQAAEITGDTITVNWVSDGGDTTSVYWVGTFTPPTAGNGPHTWTSTRDKAATDTALLASTDDSKDFMVEDGELSYSVSAMGTTATVRLEKE